MNLMRLMKNTGLLPVLGAAALVLSACGGGGGGGINTGAVAVTSASVVTLVPGEPLLITLQGRNLDQTFLIAAPGCEGLGLSSEAPYVSTASTAYLRCTPIQTGTLRFTAVRQNDSVVLADLPIEVSERYARVTSATLTTPQWGQPLRITLRGFNLERPFDFSAPDCSGLAFSTAAFEPRTSFTAYLRCTPSKVGTFQFSAVRQTDGVVMATRPFTVPEPQVTLTVDNGAGVAGTLVLSLEATKAPETVNNFLNYVHSGFYVDTVFHRAIAGFIVQGGGYAKTLVPGGTVPALKAVNAPIALEDNAGLSNLRYTVAMARTNVLASATSQFFFNLVDNTFLDRSATQRGYAVFGSITTGTDVLAAMVAAPCSAWPEFFGTGDNNACLPAPNLVITSAVQTR